MRFARTDGGRAQAGFTENDKIGDCAVRAIAIATEIDYRVVYEELLDIQDQMLAKKMRRVKNRKQYAAYAKALGTLDHGVYKFVSHPYLLNLGWHWTATMAIGVGCKVHLTASELPAGRLIVKVSKHLTAVINGEIHDTFNPSRDGLRCVYGFYSDPRVL